jgi:hypothetical protein
VAASGFQADIFNAMGLTYYEKQRIEIRFPGIIENFDPSLIVAYYVDWDILSFVQDKVPGLLADASGIRRELDGPFDSEINRATLNAIIVIAVGGISGGPVGAASAILGLEAARPMFRAHYRSAYLYGLLVTENSFGSIVQDVLGYSKSDLDIGRKP